MADDLYVIEVLVAELDVVGGDVVEVLVAEVDVVGWGMRSIFNASLTSGVFPSAWKMAEITPIPKEGDHEQANNNRPISLLPMLSKVCEKVVLNQVVSYLDINKRLSTEQSGNKKYHSTETSLIETTDTFLHAIDKRK